VYKGFRYGNWKLTCMRDLYCIIYFVFIYNVVVVVTITLTLHK